MKRNKKVFYLKKHWRSVLFWSIIFYKDIVFFLNFILSRISTKRHRRLFYTSKLLSLFFFFTFSWTAFVLVFRWLILEINRTIMLLRCINLNYKSKTLKTISFNFLSIGVKMSNHKNALPLYVYTTLSVIKLYNLKQ